MEVKEQKEFREERFEFALYVNDFVICKRNFRINNFIEDSMSSLEFKDTVDKVVNMIDNDLKSKSRVYTWYFFDEKCPDEEFTTPLIEPWECTFKFVVLDNKREVFTKIWDGRAYPRSVREKVDLANKFVKFYDKNGNSILYDKNEFFEKNKGKLSHELYVLKAQIMDKSDILLAITREICNTCALKEGVRQNLGDMTTSDVYESFDYESKGDNGGVVVKKKRPNKKYYFNTNSTYRKYVSEWGKAVSEKTKKYFDNLY